jgi:hypothetical protein
MQTPTRWFVALALPLVLVLGGCGDDDTDETLDTIDDTVEDVAEDVQEAADDAWASFRTNLERLGDEIEGGDDGAREELLDECRDTLQDLREADDPQADRLGDVCDRIRDADDDTSWDDLREEIDDIDADR